MNRRLTPLLTTILALTLLGSASAEGDAVEEASQFSVLANSTLSCSAALPSVTVGCFLERPLLVLGGFEVAVGVDAQAVLTGSWDDAHLAPYVILAAYLDTWSVWAEVRLPELSGVPVIGSPDWLRVGFTLRL